MGGGGRPDVVYHLASLLLSTHKFNDIKNLIQSNITFGTELLDAMAANGIRNFVNAETFAQHYEDVDYSPATLYAATKQCFNDIVRFYVDAYQLKCISLCIFHTYGTGDKSLRIIGLLKKIHDTGETLKMSPGGQLVDIVHVDDIVDAFVMAGEYLAEHRYDYCGTYGLSSMKPIPLREVVKIFEEVAGRKLPIEWGGLPYRAREIMVPWKSFKQFPGWRSKTDLREGIKALLES